MKLENLSKIAEGLFCRPQGATMDEVVAATGDYRYNVLRRLEAKGYVVRRKREGRATRYFAEPPEVRRFELKVAPNGQVTLPKEAREQLDVARGGRLNLTLEKGRRAVVTPASIDISDLKGILPKPRRAATLEEIEEGIVRGATRA